MRESKVSRKTNETDIEVKIDLDGSGISDIDTGIAFFDHMLNSFSKHGSFDLTIKALGDLTVDDHHTVEDVGITLGKVIEKALGEKKVSSALQMQESPWMKRLLWLLSI